MISNSTTASSIKTEYERKLDKEFTIFVNKQLGKGGFGQLYLGRNIRENTFIAIKVEELTQRSHLTMEYQILKEVQRDGIPKVYKLNNGHKHNYLLMQLLGKSLDKLFTDTNRKFSIKTVSQIAYQMVQRIEYVHSKGNIHRDIKPGNFLMENIGNQKKYTLLIFVYRKNILIKIIIILYIKKEKV